MQTTRFQSKNQEILSALHLEDNIGLDIFFIEMLDASRKGVKNKREGIIWLLSKASLSSWHERSEQLWSSPLRKVPVEPEKGQWCGSRGGAAFLGRETEKLGFLVRSGEGWGRSTRVQDTLVVVEMVNMALRFTKSQRLGLKQVRSARCLTNFSNCVPWEAAVEVGSVSGVKKGVVQRYWKGTSGCDLPRPCTVVVDCEGAGGEGTAEGPHPRALHKHLSTASYLLCWRQSTSLHAFFSSYIFNIFILLSSTNAGWVEVGYHLELCCPAGRNAPSRHPSCKVPPPVLSSAHESPRLGQSWGLGGQQQMAELLVGVRSIVSAFRSDVLSSGISSFPCTVPMGNVLLQRLVLAAHLRTGTPN